MSKIESIPLTGTILDSFNIEDKKREFLVVNSLGTTFTVFICNQREEENKIFINVNGILFLDRQEYEKFGYEIVRSGINKYLNKVCYGFDTSIPFDPTIFENLEYETLCNIVIAGNMEYPEFVDLIWKNRESISFKIADIIPFLLNYFNDYSSIDGYRIINLALSLDSLTGFQKFNAVRNFVNKLPIEKIDYDTTFFEYLIDNEGLNLINSNFKYVLDPKTLEVSLKMGARAKYLEEF